MRHTISFEKFGIAVRLYYLFFKKIIKKNPSIAMRIYWIEYFFWKNPSIAAWLHDFSYKKFYLEKLGTTESSRAALLLHFKNPGKTQYSYYFFLKKWEN